MKRVARSVRYYARTGAAALGLALLISALLVAVVAAHGPEVFIRSDPPDGAVLEQAPAQVTAWFSDELLTGQSSLQVFDADGRQVDNGDGGVDLNDPDHASMVVSLPPELPDGTYTVRWRASLDDGDVVERGFTFTVGDRVAVSQAVASGPLPASEGVGWPVGWIVAGLGVLLLLVVMAGLYVQRQLISSG